VANMLLLRPSIISTVRPARGAIDNEPPLGLNESLQHAIDQLLCHGEDEIVSVVFDLVAI